jgi:Tfp pilus assembly protein PilF
VLVAPQSEKAYLGRADVLESAGQPEQALNDCQNAVRINPNSAAGYLCRAESYLKMKLAERAVEDVNRAVVTAQTFNQPLPLGSSLAQALQESVSAPVSAAAVPPVAASPVPMPVAAQPVVASVAQPPVATAVSPQPVVSQPGVSQPIASQPLLNPFARQPLAAPVTSQPASQPRTIAAGPSPIAGRAQGPAPSAAQQASAQQFVQQGRELVQKNQFNEALSPLDHAIDTDPWSAPAYNLRGYAYLRLLQFDQALADCNEAIRLQPNFLNAYENRASARRHKGDYAGAQEDARKVSDLLAGPQKPAAANSSLSAKR